MPTEKLISLDDFLGIGRKTYTWTVPSSGARVKLQRLTHGAVNQFNQEFRDAGNIITYAIQDAIVAAGLVEPAVTVEQLRDAIGSAQMIADLYVQIASECGFIQDPRGAKPTVYIPGALDTIDSDLLAAHFTVVEGPRPAEDAKGDDADPLIPATPADASPTGNAT